MSTPKQIAANRLNAQKSAGPRSAQGKAASRVNSLKTGLYSRSQGATDSVRDHPNGKGLNFIRCREYFPLLQRRVDSAQRTFHRALHDLERLQAKRRAAAPRSTDRAVGEPPPEAKANFAQPQSAQQTIGFVPSFCPIPDSHSPEPRAACADPERPAPQGLEPFSGLQE
jgi:hypothetical protein